jgi:hypothetical protein
MLDLHPDEDLSTYSTPDLIDEVKRIVMGPQTWSPASGSCKHSGPTLRRRSVIAFDYPRAGAHTVFSVLPGGRYFAMTDRWNDSGIWEIATGRCLWTHPQHVSGCSFDMVDGGSAVVLVCHFQYSL